MTLGYTTIVTQIASGQMQALERYLKTDVAPKFHPKAFMVCEPLVPFDQIKGLHFCSMVILHEVGCPLLVFEATFDGTREEFLDDLLRVASQGIHEIYLKCVGYPESGLEVPELVKEYLLRHDVGAQTFYTGSPGRSVAQIKGEEDIQKEIVSFVGSRRAQARPPTTHLDLQRDLQTEVIRSRPKNQWAEQPAVVPWEVTQRKFVAGVAGLALLATICCVGALALPLGAWRPDDILKAIEPFAPILWAVVWIIVWMALRGVELASDMKNPRAKLDVKDPRARRFGKRYAVLSLFVLRCYALAVLLLGVAVLSRPMPSIVAGEDAALEFLLKLLVAICLWLLALIALAVIWLVLRARATTLKLLVQFKELTPWGENRRRYMLDFMHFLMAVVVGLALLVTGSYLPDSITQAMIFYAWWVLVLSFYGVVVFYLLGFALFLVVKYLERTDRRHFAPAAQLITKVDKHASVYQREEGGVNKYQNHLASLTYVKPGILRDALLRLTLLAIGLLSRFWFNQGRLGGIPTILAARWVLIKDTGGGQRLLFLTNYGGAWDSYLNEFIDMGAVIGLNAIWSNTFLKLDNIEYAFPETAFYFWKGAEAEKPFKAYVRCSQIETIVWYSAYPKLSILNINSNTDLRQALFKPVAPCELDLVFHKAGL